jgi:protein TonB
VLLPPTKYIDIKTPDDIDPRPSPPTTPIELTGVPLDVPVPTPPEYAYVVEAPPQQPKGPVVADSAPPAPKAPPVVQTPEIDPRVGLSEPAYPASEIRLEHTGTVLLSVYVLANGRVGDVRLDQSSGWPKLDESALREARRWRFKAGMQDGVPMAMWRQVPITFQLQGRK